LKGTPPSFLIQAGAWSRTLRNTPFSKMNVVKSTVAYERWLSAFVPLIDKDLKLKHKSMRRDAFTFFRATFYLWAELWQRLPTSISAAPQVLGVGDAHVENFGTWCDKEGRLVWGVNDFDEAADLPYTNDLVRLAASGVFARAEGALRISKPAVVDNILVGYSAALKHGGAPFVIEERNHWLRKLAHGAARAPERFWSKFAALEPWREPVPKRASTLIHDVPRDARLVRTVHRIAGAGSLGRPRVAALYEWRGGYMAREAKARAPSAWVRTSDVSVKRNARALPGIWQRAVRCQDPHLRVTRHWIVKRIAPDCSRIELASLPKVRQEAALMRAMGWEIANIHLGSASPRSIGEHLRSLNRNWLIEATESMTHVMREAFADWRRHG
jgi:hypothetical protein